MKILVLTTVLSAVVLLSSSMAATAKQLTFGDKVEMKKLQPLSELLKQPEQFVNKQITIKGKIVEACAKRGCWMQLKAENEQGTVRVKVKDGDMVFPVSKRGSTAYATGTFTGRSLTLKQTVAYYQHLAQEQGHDFDPASVTEAMRLYQLKPTAVIIE